MHAGSPSTRHSSLAERYEVLLEIGRTLTGTLSLKELYRALLREVSRVLPTDGFYVSLYDAPSDQARIVLFSDAGAVSTDETSYRGSDSRVLRDGEGILVRDGLEEHSLVVLGDADGRVTRSGISVPMRLKGRILGAISSQSFKPDAFTDDDLALLQAIADLAVVALENARYVAELKRRRREAEQVESIGRALAASLDTNTVLGKVAEAVVDVLEAADGAAVWLMEPDTVARLEADAGAVRLPPGSEWQLEASEREALVRAGRGIVVDDLAAYPHVPAGLREHLSSGSALAAPLTAGGSVTGVLSCGSRQRGALGARELDVLTRLASQASVALENARLHASVHSLSRTDALTGLPNRRHLDLHLEREVAAARRGRRLVAIIFDLDNFKAYNDRYGHLAGDEALRAFAAILDEENRAMNLVARYGGDEFVSILSDSTPEGAAHYVERIRTRVAEDPVLAPGSITVSSGIAPYVDGEMVRGDDLLQAADHDLFREKGSRD
jgi:diguanylate cyclase (GGDEF)-like protein